MQNWWISWKMSQIKQAEILNQAAAFRARERRKQSGHSERKKGDSRVYGSRRSLGLLYIIGGVLVRWGKALQQRQGFHLRALDCRSETG